jgi:hypothetical protein
MFFDYIPGFLILPQPNKLRMPQVILSRPLKKTDLRDYLRSNPNTFLHLFRIHWGASAMGAG